MRLWMVCILLTLGGACDCGSSGAPGDFVVLDEGDGPANEEPLFFLADGEVFNSFVNFQATLTVGERDSLIRGPFDMDGHRIFRGIQSTNEAIPTLDETFLSQDEDGVWLAGSVADGLLPSSVLLVPSTVRVGKRWRSTPGSSYSTYTFEVLDRYLAPGSMGEEIVVWEIAQFIDDSDEPDFYRYYAEGWGLLAVSDQPSSFERVDSKARMVRLGADDELLELPDLELVPGSVHEIELQPHGEVIADSQLDILRGIRSSDDKRTHLSFIGHISGGPGSTANRGGASLMLTYSAGDGSEAGDFNYAPFYVWPDPLLDAWDPVGFDGRYSVAETYGNALYTEAGLFASTADRLLFENISGGINAGDRAEETLVAPGFDPDVQARIWESSGLQGRILQGPAGHTGDIYYGLVDAFDQNGASQRWYSTLWSTAIHDLGLTKVHEEAHLVDVLPQPVSTLTSTEGDVHYAVSPSGVIERISFGPDGTRRDLLGRAQVPAGQTLRAAVELGDGYLALVTRSTSSNEQFLWTAKAAAAVPEPESKAIFVTEEGLDARVCWGESSQKLDVEGWSLGGVPALSVLPLANHCALIVRDLAARPIPAEAERRPYIHGWGVVEGPVPGVGLVRALYDTAAIELSPQNPTASDNENAWLLGGGFIERTSNSPFADMEPQFFRRGMLDGGSPAFTNLGTFPAHAGTAGEGIWMEGARALALDETGTTLREEGYGLGGPSPHFFPYADGFTGPQQAIHSLQQGGLLVPASVLADSTHDGLAKLRPDGSIEEIEHPADGTPFVELSNGDLCGMRPGNSGNNLYCASPEGVVREAPIAAGFVSVRELSYSTPLYDDRYSVMVTADKSVVTVDWQELSIALYPMPAGLQQPFDVRGGHIGADGQLYAAVFSDNASFFYALFAPDGLIRIDDMIELRSFYAEPSDAHPEKISGVRVGEDMVYLSDVSFSYRIPRAIWDAAQ
jgi:hypothetical protein